MHVFFSLRFVDFFFSYASFRRLFDSLFMLTCITNLCLALACLTTGFDITGLPQPVAHMTPGSLLQRLSIVTIVKLKLEVYIFYVKKKNVLRHVLHFSNKNYRQLCACNVIGKQMYTQTFAVIRTQNEFYIFCSITSCYPNEV